ncbi:MAG TPA: oligosaccharide flippase family protein [Burkholderiales bacterium]|nr:oligosaccharide flippase family protein [Burkholderiales bacterium]
MRREDLALDELAARARSGTHAMLATRVLSVVSTAVSIAILPRLIPPADFGIWAMATLAFGALTIVRQFGLVASIAQGASLTPRQQDAYFWTSVWLSLGTAALLAAGAPLLARFYGTPVLQPISWILALVLVIEGLGFVQTAFLRRELRYDKVALIEGTGTLVTLTTLVTCALLWGNVWALLAGQVAYGVWTTLAASVAYGRLPGPPRRETGMDLRFGLHLASYNVVTYLANNISLVAGFRLGATQVGFLNRALQFFHITYTSLLMPVTDVVLSFLCRLRAEEDYRRGYVAMAQRAWMLVLPLALVLPIIADDLMLCLLGRAWLPAAPLLAWFSLAIIARGFASLFAQLLTSQGRGAELHRWAIVDLALRAGGAFAGAAFGVIGIAAGFSLVSFFVTLPAMVWIAGRSGPVKLRDQIEAARPAFMVGCVAALVSGAVLVAATHAGLEPGWARFVLVGGAAAAAGGLATFLIRSARQALLGTGIAEALRAHR